MAFDFRNDFVIASVTSPESAARVCPSSFPLMSSRDSEWLLKVLSGNNPLVFMDRSSSESMSDQIALHASQAARNRFVAPDMKLSPEDSKHRHKESTMPEDKAWSKICLRVLFIPGTQDSSGVEVMAEALRD